jgi:hypothetical protein
VLPHRVAATNTTKVSTMALLFDENPKETQNPDENLIKDDDITVTAETQPTKMDFIESEMTDLNIPNKIPYNNGTTVNR